MWELRASRDGTHKMEAINTRSGKKVRFGALGYSDFLLHGDIARRDRYLKRHIEREDWTDPDTAGFWSRWILWGPSIRLRENANLVAYLLGEPVKVRGMPSTNLSKRSVGKRAIAK